MNTFAIIVASFLVADFSLQSLADYLNARSAEQTPPPILAGLYDDASRERMVAHLRAATRLALTERACLLAVLLAFWFLGGFGFLEKLVSDNLVGLIPRGLGYAGAVVAGYALLETPFDAYSTFVIEERFGFNRTTWRTFVADRIKGMLLAAVVGAFVLSGVLLLFSRLGDSAWLVCWAFVLLFSIGMQLIAPALILPLFNRFEPMPDGGLKDEILAYARSVSYAVENVFVMDGSRRTTKGNAFFTGFGKHRRIALYDTLVDAHPADEIVSVLAHEVGHYKKHHVVRALIVGSLHTGAVLFLFSLVVDWPVLYAAFGLGAPSLATGLVCFAIAISPIESMVAIGLNAISRRHEYEADRFAVATAPEPAALREALMRLSRGHLSNPNPHPLYVLLHYSHPPLTSRLAALESLQSAARSGRTE